jgi:hypothetical protein
MNIQHLIDGDMVFAQVGEIGLSVAMQFYGAECVINAGSWLTLAHIKIPTVDWEAYLELTEYAVNKHKRGASWREW